MTGIEWTDTTWNPVTGCDRISAGCDNCYALALAKRLKAMGSAKYQNDGDPRTSGPGFGVTVHPAALDIPRRWRSPRRVFVNSMSDLFHARVPASFVQQVIEVIAETPQHTYQVLTKRPGRARRMVVERGLVLPPNLWLGTSIEHGGVTDRITELVNTPAAVRFLSCEPLLGPIDLGKWLFPLGCPDGCGCRWPGDDERFECGCPGCEDWRPIPAINWVIAGGESGPNARPVHPDWVRDLRDQCVDGNVAFFFKQWGGRTPKVAGRELDGELWNQYPTDRSIACHA
jgi:protein gp37